MTLENFPKRNKLPYEVIYWSNVNWLMVYWCPWRLFGGRVTTVTTSVLELAYISIVTLYCLKYLTDASASQPIRSQRRMPAAEKCWRRRSDLGERHRERTYTTTAVALCHGNVFSLKSVLFVRIKFFFFLFSREARSRNPNIEADCSLITVFIVCRVMGCLCQCVCVNVIV